ncbi:MAG: DUF2075 domain-containing protein [Opitutales bacterium]|nr:DUF2075 domain-containing protein [Opitutales bacterium]
MPLIKRYYYGASISSFIDESLEKICYELGEGHLNQHTSLESTQKRAWEEEIKLLKKVLKNYKNRGSIYFEYNIPRMGRRIDVVALIDGIVFILEFKAFNEQFSKQDIAQVWDYALDLKNFHEASHNRFIVPILVSTAAELPHNNFKIYSDRIFYPILTNADGISEIIDTIFQKVKDESSDKVSSDDEWAVSRYSPTPTIVEAASSLYLNHSVEEISRHDSAENLSKTSAFVSKIIERSKANNEKSICFVTGVPGAGKTLVGLNIATEQFKKGEIATYLSGNFPLVEVLTEALARDKVAKEKENGNKFTKSKATSEVKTFIQMIHHYRDTCLQGAKIENGKIVMDEEYFRKVKNKNKHYAPVDHVAIFDESQRAWTQAQLTNFMSRKKGVAGFPYSEPEYLISCLDRHQDWAVIVCLVGGGQEINTGEAGIGEWIAALNKDYKHWHIYISDRLTEKEYSEGRVLESIENKNRITIEPALHLAVSMRSFRAENVSNFVHNLLESNVAEAKNLLSSLEKYPIVLTRDKNIAKQWLRTQSRGSERYGIIASSAGERLRPEEIVVRLKADVVHWLLDDVNDIRSSLFMEDVATEFDVQGLELDWVCVAWDGDFRYSNGDWQYYQFNGGNKWNNINKPERRLYRKNAYRVLLTRARQGMVIFVPKGNKNDPTRLPEFYDSTFNYLKSLGIKVLEDEQTL